MDYGEKNIQEFAELLERREFMSEFNSPTYCALTICAMAELAVDGKYLVLEIYNYKGEGRVYPKKLLRSLSNGFIFEAEEAAEMTFETLCEKYSQYTLSDKLVMNVHTRYSMMREVKYQCNGVKLACCISPITTGVKYIMAK